MADIEIDCQSESDTPFRTVTRITECSATITNTAIILYGNIISASSK